MGGLGGAQATAPFLVKPVWPDHRILGTEGDYWFNATRVGVDQARAFLQSGERLGSCGPAWLVLKKHLALAGLPTDYVDYASDEFHQTRIVLAIPRETACGCARIRDLETRRPILVRGERGGEFVYEVLGPEDGYKREPRFPNSPYCHDEYSLSHD